MSALAASPRRDDDANARDDFHARGASQRRRYGFAPVETVEGRPSGGAAWYIGRRVLRGSVCYRPLIPLRPGISANRGRDAHGSGPGVRSVLRTCAVPVPCPASQSETYRPIAGDGNTTWSDRRRLWGGLTPMPRSKVTLDSKLPRYSKVGTSMRTLHSGTQPENGAPHPSLSGSGSLCGCSGTGPTPKRQNSSSPRSSRRLKA